VALLPGSTAGPYRIVEPLGRGGMASVYRAYEPALDRYVALKVLPREFLHDPSFAERFRREAKVIARLEHPNIVPIYAFDIEQAEGIPWMAMRLIAGGSLSQLLKREQLGFARSVAILRGVAAALDHAHGKGIVHRDVKPQNVLLDEERRVYLADFGIAKILESPGGLTATGMITGTPQYMAPEQATATNVDRHADIYALGIVAYELFTGHVPFSADTPVAVLMKHIQEPLPLPPPSTVPESLLRPVLRCTSKKPADRWPSAGAFVAALEAGLEAQALPVLADVGPVASPRTAPAPTLVPSRPASPSVAGATPPAVVSPPPAAATTPRAVARPAGPRPALLLGLAGAVLMTVAAATAALVLMSRGPREARPSLEPRAAGPPATPAATAASAAPPPRGAASAPPAKSSARATLSPAAGRPALPPTTSPVTPEIRLPPPASGPPSEAEPAAPTVAPEVQRAIAALGQPDANARWRAAEALGALGADASPAVPALAAALGDRSETVRWRSAEALGRIGGGARGAVPALVRALGDGDPIVRNEAAKALGLVGPAAAEAAPRLVEGLQASDVSYRREAARSLSRIGVGSAPVLHALVEALKDKDKFVRMEAARALGRIGPPAREAVPALTALLRDSELLVSREAQAALRSIGGS
jgi:serine/threonine-protein kinase